MSLLTLAMMNKFPYPKFVLGLLILLPIIISCTPPSFEKKLEGKWEMYLVYESEDDVTSEHNPKGNRYIEFKIDGTFESGGDPFGLNTGKWHREKSILFIDSNADDDDSEWQVTFIGDKMIWEGMGTPRKDAFTLIHQKKQ